jgi:hypothetical protein
MKRIVRGVVLVMVLAACSETATVDPDTQIAATGGRTEVNAAFVVDVSNVEQLYAAVNNSAYAGAQVRLATGTYVLSSTAAGVPRPNGGRLELQPDMSLVGQVGDRSAAVIDMSHLPNASFNVSLGKTAGVRIGLGSNAIEWITIIGNANSAAGIETDLANGHSAEVTIAHIVAHGSIRGIDVRNTTAAMAGRRVVARIDDNEFYGNNEGIRVLNSSSATGGDVDVTMSGNRVHDNTNGCIIEHNRASNAFIRVRSSGDRFEHNALGCLIGGGLVAAPGVAHSNSTVFEAYGDTFVNNTLAVSSIDYGGVLVVGAETPGVANSASHNTVTVSLWGTRVSENQNVDFQAYGARSVAVPAGISGVGNQVTIELNGVSKKIEVDAVMSLPFEAASTNSVTVSR